jgi:hypothetical protein
MLKLGKGLMRITRPGHAAAALAILLAVVSSCASPSGPTGGGGGDPTGQTVTMLAAGDIGLCGSPAVAQTARLVSGLEGELLLGGDIAYFQGTAENFRDCFNPFWGQFRSRWHPVPGNHEYESPGAARTSRTSERRPGRRVVVITP